MIDFEFVSPTKLFFGKKKEEEIGRIISNYGFSSVFIVYGGGHIVSNGLYQRVISRLDEAGIKHEEAHGVRANPTREFVLAAREKLRAVHPDLILAIGGGSVIDTAKSLAVSYEYGGDPFDFNLKKVVPTKALPIGVILTHASAGSEASNSCVIQNDETKIKAGFNSDLVRPLFAIENPELTYSVSAYQTACGVSDIMMHSLERFFDPSSPDLLADDWALDLVKNTMKWGAIAVKEPNNYEARAAVMLNSTLSHNGLTHLGKPFGFVVHPLEHALSGYAPNIVHGAGVALLYPAWASYVVNVDSSKFAYLTKRIFEIEGTNEKETAIIGINKMKEYFSSLGMPTSFQEAGLGEKDIPALVALASGNGTRAIGCYPQSLQERDIERIYRSLLS